MAVRKRGSRWWYDFRVRGVRYRAAIPEARTKAQAEQAETRVRTDVFEGRYGRQLGTMNVAKFIDDYYLPWARQNKSPSSQDEVRVAPIKEFFRGKTFAEVTQFLVEKFKAQRLKTPTKWDGPRSAGSVNTELGILSRIFTLAVETGKAQFNPCAGVKRLKVKERERYLTGDEEARLLQALSEQPRRWLEALSRLALGTGMRLGECVTLTWNRVDFERGVIRVPKMKTDEGRHVPMTDTVRGLLLELGPGEGLVFPAARAEFISRAQVGVRFREVCEAAGVKDFHFHDLRHTAATKMLDAGVNTLNIMRVLGHSSMKMTAVYAHGTDEGLRRAVEALAEKSGHVLVTMPAKAG